LSPFAELRQGQQSREPSVAFWRKYDSDLAYRARVRPKNDVDHQSPELEQPHAVFGHTVLSGKSSSQACLTVCMARRSPLISPPQ